MKTIITFALTAVLAVSLVSCGTQKSNDNEAQASETANTDSASTMSADTVDVLTFFSDRYWDGNELESLCANNEKQYVIYKGNKKTVMNSADYYNALMMVSSLYSDLATTQRFGEGDDSVCNIMSNSVKLLDYTIIHNEKLRGLVKRIRDIMADYARNINDENFDTDKVGAASDKVYDYISTRVNPLLESTRDAYMAYFEREGIYNNFDSILAKRGLSDKKYQEELLLKMDSAESPAERHVYAIEYAHSDTTHAYFLWGAVRLNNAIERGDYSPYLSEMWKTWRTIVSSMAGASSWSYIPNLLYNEKRGQVAEIIIKHLDENPNDSLAQGVLIDLAGTADISRHGSILGNSIMVEQMNMFPEWEME